jgi:hypothetical protein
VRHHTLVAGMYLVLLGATAARAQSPQFETWKDTGTTKAPIRTCASLRALSGYEFSVDVAESIAATKDTPAFCRVTGLVQPEIRFEVSLPMAWNGRLNMFGNGGFAGESLTAGFRASRRNLAVSKGFVAAQTNTGHDASREPLASFAAHPQKLSDYAYRAVHVTAVTAKALARAFYGNTDVLVLRWMLDRRAAGAHQRPAISRRLRRHRRGRSGARLHGDDDALHASASGADEIAA